MGQHLTKSDWKKLYKVGLTDGGIGNGFAKPSDKFNKEITCILNEPTMIIDYNKCRYVVQKHRKFELPIWRKSYLYIDDVKIAYQISKNGLITKLK